MHVRDGVARLPGIAVAGMLILCGCGERKTAEESCVPAPSSSMVVNVQDAAYGAKGDGVADDTTVIQKAVDAVKGTGGTVTIPAGTYVVNAVQAIRLGNNMTLRLAPGAVLKAKPNSAANYAIVLVKGVSDVNVVGGTLEGDRGGHIPLDPQNPGEWGMGLQIDNSQRVAIDGVTAKECWGDGFYVGATSQDVTFCHVTSDHNRRQGMSITDVDGMVVKNSTFKNTQGTPPEYGIDIEPNSGESVNDVLINGCTFENNSAGGISSGVPGKNTGVAWTTGIVIDGNRITGNGHGTSISYAGRGIEVSNASGHQVTNNTVTGQVGIGIYLRDGAGNSLVSGNTVTGTTANTEKSENGEGIMLYKTAGNTVTGNTVTGNAGCGIRDAYPSGDNTISGNDVSGNGTCP